MISRGIIQACAMGSLLVLLAFAGLASVGSRRSSSAAVQPSSGSTALEAAPPSLTTAGLGYRYQKIESLNSSSHGFPGGVNFMALLPTIREVWIAPDGSGRIKETVGEPIFLTERDREAWKTAGAPDVFRGMNRDFGPGGLTYEGHHPTDPVALGVMLREQAARTQVPVDDEMFVIVGDIARMPSVPEALSRALYEVAAGIPGVEQVGEVADRVGRRGVAVANVADYNGAKTSSLLVFDLAHGALLGEEETWLEPPAALSHIKTPVVVGYTTYLDLGMVSELPGGPLVPRPSIAPSMGPVEMRPTEGTGAAFESHPESDCGKWRSGGTISSDEARKLPPEERAKYGFGQCPSKERVAQAQLEEQADPKLQQKPTDFEEWRRSKAATSTYDP